MEAPADPLIKLLRNKSPLLPWAAGLFLVSATLPKTSLPDPAGASSVLTWVHKAARSVAGHKAPEKGDCLSSAPHGCIPPGAPQTSANKVPKGRRKSLKPGSLPCTLEKRHVNWLPSLSPTISLGPWKKGCRGERGIEGPEPACLQICS